jgi:hypothetical protein
MTEAELDAYALGPIKRLITNKSPSEILAIRNELQNNLHSTIEGLANITPKEGEDGLIAIRNHLMQRRLEVNFLNSIVG